MKDQAAGPLPSKKVQFRLRIREPLTREPPARESPSAEPRPAARGNTTRGCDERVGVLTGSPGLGKTRHGVAPDEAPCRCGRRGLGPEATQGAPRSSRQSGLIAVVPIVTHTPTPPHVAFFRAPMDDSSHEKGDSPLFERVNAPCVTRDPLRTSTSTQENGSRCAAQRAGGRLAVY